MATHDFSLFDELAPPIVNVRVNTGYGREQVIRMGVLSFHEWEEIGALVPDPQVRRKMQGNDTAPDYSHPEYRKEAAEVSVKRGCLRLVRSLEIGGYPIPGDTLEAKADALRTRDMGVLNALLRALQKLCLEGQAKVEDLAGNFLGVSVGGNEDVPANTNVAGGVEGTP